MAIGIDDSLTESTLSEMAAAQPVRTNKTALAHAILRAAAERFRASGDPLSWQPSAQLSSSANGNSTGGASIPARTDFDPSQQTVSPVSQSPQSTSHSEADKTNETA